MESTDNATSSASQRGAEVSDGMQSSAQSVARGHLVLIFLFSPAVVALAWSSAMRVPMIPSDTAGPRAELIDGRLDINRAPWWELTALPRIGRITAGKITDYRTDKRKQHPDRPPFRDGEELQEVNGIGPKTAAQLEPYIRWP